MKKILFYVMLLSLLAGCKEEEESNFSNVLCDKTMKLMDSNDYHAIKNKEEELNIISATLDGDFLKVHISRGGGCADNQQVYLIGNKTTTYLLNATTDTPLRNLKLVFSENDPCKALLLEKYCFNIKDSRVDGSSRIRLILENWESVTYDY